MRKLGISNQAAKIFLPIFSSGVNERDLRANLMRAYRNYRHRSAMEIAWCFGDPWSYPRVYYWAVLAIKRYRYLSWCGTCRWGAERRMQRTLLVTSLRAEPVFLVATLLMSPIANWYISCSGGLFVFLRRKLHKRRANRALAFRDPL